MDASEGWLPPASPSAVDVRRLTGTPTPLHAQSVSSHFTGPRGLTNERQRSPRRAFLAGVPASTDRFHPELRNKSTMVLLLIGITYRRIRERHRGSGPEARFRGTLHPEGR